jgi:RHS repeat-associated protein
MSLFGAVRTRRRWSWLVVPAAFVVGAALLQGGPVQGQSTTTITAATTSTTRAATTSTTTAATTSTTRAATTSTTTAATTSTTRAATTSTTVGLSTSTTSSSSTSTTSTVPAVVGVPLTGAPQCSWSNTAGSTAWGAYGWISGGQALVQTGTAPCVLDPDGVLRFKVGTNRAGAFAFGETCTGDNNTGPPTPLYFTATVGVSVGTFAVAVWCVSATSDAQMNVGLVGPGLPTVRVGAWDFPVRKLTVAAVGSPLKITTAQTVELDFSAADGSVTLRSGAQSIAVPEMANRFPSGAGAGIRIVPTDAPVFQRETFTSGATIEGTFSASLAFSLESLFGQSYFRFYKPGSTPAVVADPVNTATGGLDHGVSDLSVPGRGESLLLTRNYDSRQPDSSSLGRGWWHSYVQSVSVVSGSGALRWRAGSGGVIEFPAVAGGTFGVVPGVRVVASSVAGGGWQILADDQTRHLFDASGKLVSIRDRSGQGVTLSYDASNRVSVVTDATARTFTFTYGIGTTATGGVAGTGRLVQVLGSDGRLVKYAYTGVSGSSQLTSVTDVRGKVWTYAYTATGFLESEKDPNLATQFFNTFDALGRVKSQKDQFNNLSLFDYDDVAGTTTMTDSTQAVSIWSRSGNLPRAATNPGGTSSKQFNAALDVTSFTDADQKTWVAEYDGRGNMLQRTAPAPLSYVEKWTYDSFNNPLTFIDGRNNQTTYTYDANGRLDTESRPLGQKFSYVWNPDGTLASLKDPRDGITAYGYDSVGNVTSVTTPMGFKTTYTYDAAGRVLTITEPRGNVVGATTANFVQKFTYDNAGNVLTETDALGRRYTHTYDNAGLRKTTLAPDTGLTLFDYNVAHELIKVTFPDGGITEYDYDSRGLMKFEKSTATGMTTYKYDPAGRLETKVDPRGYVPGGNPADYTWTYGYDNASRLKTIVDPLGRTTTIAYDVLGRTKTTTRPDGTTTVEYDPNGNVTSTVTEAGTWSQTYDALNRVETATDIRGKLSSFGYDLASNQTSSTDPLLRVTRSTYDPDGRLKTVIDPRGTLDNNALAAQFTTTFVYDEANHQTQVTDNLGLITKQSFDRVGNMASSTNAKNLVTTYAYDSMNRPITVTAPVVGATKYTYSTMGYVLTRTDPLSTATVPRVGSWAYDTAGRVKEKKDASGNRFTYSYDVAGNQTLIVDANANGPSYPVIGSTTMVYDRLNRLTQRSYSDGTPTVTYTYDTQGRLETMVDGIGTMTYGYDTADRVNSMVRPNNGGTPFSYSWGFAYTYDAAGNVLTRPNATLTYDDAGQLSTHKDQTGALTTFGYDGAGNMTSMVLPNGVTHNRSYDRASRLETITNTGPQGAIGGFTYGRDNNGNPTIVDVSGPAGVIATESMRNTYDNYDRLTKTCYTTTTCTTANQTLWTYDQVGNRLTEQIGTAAQSVYIYDITDRLKTITGPGAANFYHNSNGDVVQIATSTTNEFLRYNTARQLTGRDTGSGMVPYSYDGNGDLTRIGANGAATDQHWDVVGGMAMLVGVKPQSNPYWTRYSNAGSLPVSTKFDLSQGSSFYLTDGVGSVTNLTAKGTGTANGFVSATYRYTPFGVSRSAVTAAVPGQNDYATTNTELFYTGQQRMANGDYNMRARRYNPTRGSFTQTDPMPYGAGTAYESSYVYGRNNPLLMNDPTGLRAQRGGGFWSGLWNAAEGFSIGTSRSVFCGATLFTFDGCIDPVVDNIQQNGVVQGVNLTLNPLIPAVNAGVACTTGTDLLQGAQVPQDYACGQAAFEVPVGIAQTVAAVEGARTLAKRFKSPELSISDSQLGKKAGKHAQDFGLDPRDPKARAQIRSTIQEIHGSPHEIRQGPWNPDTGGATNHLFYRKASDVVVTTSSGQFVTILKDGAGNGWYQAARRVGP